MHLKKVIAVIAAVVISVSAPAASASETVVKEETTKYEDAASIIKLIGAGEDDTKNSGQRVLLGSDVGEIQLNPNCNYTIEFVFRCSKEAKVQLIGENDKVLGERKTNGKNLNKFFDFRININRNGESNIYVKEESTDEYVDGNKQVSTNENVKSVKITANSQLYYNKKDFESQTKQRDISIIKKTLATNTEEYMQTDVTDIKGFFGFASIDEGKSTNINWYVNNGNKWSRNALSATPTITGGNVDFGLILTGADVSGYSAAYVVE